MPIANPSLTRTTKQEHSSYTNTSILILALRSLSLFLVGVPAVYEMSSRSSDDRRKQRKRSPIEIGTRMEIWWPLEKQYFPGTLVNQRDNDCWKIVYEDGDSEWILLSKETIRILHPKGSREAAVQEEHRLLLARIKVGSKVEVFWKPYDAWFRGTVKQIERGKSEEYLITYDTKSETWEDLWSEKVKLLDEETELDHMVEAGDPIAPKQSVDHTTITDGDRISIWFTDEEGGHFYDGKVIKATSGGKKKMYTTIRFEDGEILDVDLSKVNFRLLEQQAAAASKSNKRLRQEKHSVAISNKQNSKKPKVGSSRSTKNTLSRISDDSSCNTASMSRASNGSSNAGGPCLICKVEPMRKPRSLECCHIFCRECVKQKCGSDNRRCPICSFSLGDRVHLYSRKTLPDAFRSVVSTHLNTDERNIWPSASAAMRTLQLLGVPRAVINACRSTTQKESQYRGHSWSFHSGTSERASKEIPTHSSRSISVELFCSKTGKTLATYPSMTHAANTHKLDRKSIARVIQGKATSVRGLFFRMIAGEDEKYAAASKSSPCTDVSTGDSSFVPIPNGFPRPVEQLCAKTGAILARFASIKAAGKDLGISTSTISQIARGKVGTTKGFFFRYQGSKSLPQLSGHGSNASDETRKEVSTPSDKRRDADSEPSLGHIRVQKKRVNQLCLETGMVLATYGSLADAGKAVGCDSRKIGECCNPKASRHKTSVAGYRWQLVSQDSVNREEVSLLLEDSLEYLDYLDC